MSDSFRRRGAAMLGALLIVAGLLAGCGGGSVDDDDLRNELRTLMSQQGAMSAEEAECLADIMVDEIDNETLRDAIDAGDDSPELPADAAPAMERGFEECFELDDLMEDLDTGGDDQ